MPATEFQSSIKTRLTPVPINSRIMEKERKRERESEREREREREREKKTGRDVER